MNSQLQMEEKLRVELKLQEYFGSVPLCRGYFGFYSSSLVRSMMFLFAAISEGISWTTLTEPLLEAGLIWLLLPLGMLVSHGNMSEDRHSSTRQSAICLISL